MGGNRLILHVGAPKCGSSSLQAALSRQPDFESRAGKPFRYAVITGEGDIKLGDAVRELAAGATCRYAVSADAHDITPDEAKVLRLAQQLRDMLHDTNIILSAEGWIDASQTFKDSDIFDKIGVECEVIAYVRPQPEYLNTAWWQWSAWTSIDFEAWLFFSGFGNTCAWARFMEAWSTVSGIKSVQPRLLSKDIVGEFFESLDCVYAETGRTNRSLPATALRFLQRHRELRPDEHASDIDFVLERALGDWSAPAPWVLPFDYVTAFIEKCRPENERLMEMLSEADRAAMRTDPRWWDASFYQDRTVAFPEIVEPEATEMDAFAAALAKALLTAERDLAALRRDMLALHRRSPF